MAPKWAADLGAAMGAAKGEDWERERVGAKVVVREAQRAPATEAGSGPATAQAKAPALDQGSAPGWASATAPRWAKG